MVFFLKKYSDSQCCGKKYSDFCGGKKKSDSEFLSYLLPWHLLGHAIMSVICFDLQFSRSTRPMTSFCIFIAYKNTGNTFQRQNYKMRLKQRSLNWINSMQLQVKKILFTNVFFSWSLCLLNHRGLLRFLFFFRVLLKTTREESKMSNFHTTLFQNSFVLVSWPHSP